MNPLKTFAKSALPNAQVSLPILRGPLRGGRFYANPRVSMRKVMGLYEADLNPWLRKALQRADIVVDVGANDGYFTFGCAAAMRRQGRTVRVIAFEPLDLHVDQLEIARVNGGFTADEIKIVPKLVGSSNSSEMVTLDSFAVGASAAVCPLIKIDVEGAEMDVLEGAARWLSPRSMLLIEVHREEFLTEIPRRLHNAVGPLDRVDQNALPLLGREHRDAATWWPLSRLA